MKSHAVAGDIARLSQIISESQPSSILLVTGGQSYESSGAASAIEPLVAAIGHTSISNVDANPTIEAVTDGCALLGDAQPDLIIAIGGGSVIDLAKSVRVLAAQIGSPRDIVVSNGHGIERRGVPLVAIPTTSGTGSEVTHFAVVYVDGKKYSLTHDFVRPDHAIVDPTFTYDLPPAITASTGLDALTQAIESFWSARSTAASIEHSSSAMHLAWENLASAVNEPDKRSRLAMSEAATLAGLAIDLTTTTAPHALSYTLTSNFGVAHGNAVALTLGAVLEHNAGVTAGDCVDPRGPAHVLDRIETIVTMLGASSPAEARVVFESFVGSLGLPSTLTEVGADSPASRSLIASSVDPQRLSGNPRSFTTDQLQALIDSLD